MSHIKQPNLVCSKRATKKIIKTKNMCTYVHLKRPKSLLDLFDLNIDFLHSVVFVYVCCTNCTFHVHSTQRITLYCDCTRLGLIHYRHLILTRLCSLAHFTGSPNSLLFIHHTTTTSNIDVLGWPCSKQGLDDLSS